MRKFKRNIIFICMVTLVFVLVGCGKDSNGEKTTASTTEFVTTTEIATTTETVTEASSEATTEFVIEEYNIGEQYEANMANGEISTEMPLATGPSSDSNVVPITDPDPNVDVDLTAYTINDMVIVLNSIIFKSDEYLGKTIKISGPYHEFWDEGTGKYYHYIMIEDETACCKNGIEFICNEGSNSNSDKYPEEDEMIEIMGVYSVYEEDGYTHYYLDTDGYTVIY